MGESESGALLEQAVAQLEAAAPPSLAQTQGQADSSPVGVDADVSVNEINLQFGQVAASGCLWRLVLKKLHCQVPPKNRDKAAEFPMKSCAILQGNKRI